MSVHVINIEVTEWDQIQALERCIMSFAHALEDLGEDHELRSLFQRDMACLLLLREELKDAVDCDTEPSRPN